MPKTPDLRAVVLSVAALGIAAFLNVLVDAGTILHDMFCLTHGALG